MENVIFSDLSKKYYGGELYPKIIFHYTKNFQTRVNSSQKI